MKRENPRFGNYRLLHRLATGGMAEIFLAVDRTASPGHELVVIKRLREDLLSNREFCEMFIDEDRVIRRLDHPGIIKVRDSGDVDGRSFMAMEYVWGESLAALTRLCTVRGRQFPASLAIYIGACVADALAHAHGQRNAQGQPAPVIHRDVTLANVVVSYRGEVKILDFGIAKASGRLTETRAGQLKGTPAYLAPEQIRIGEVTPATDIYQLGVMLYHVTVGRPPLTWDNTADLMRQIVAHAILKPSAYVPDYPPALEKVVLKAMAARPQDRFGSAAELAAVLRHFVDGGLETLQPRLSSLVHELTANRHAEQTSFVAALLAEETTTPGKAPVFSWAAEAADPAGEEISVRMDRDALNATALANRPVAELVREATRREAARPPLRVVLDPPVAHDEITELEPVMPESPVLETTERVHRPGRQGHSAVRQRSVSEAVHGTGHRPGELDDSDAYWIAPTVPMDRLQVDADSSPPDTQPPRDGVTQAARRPAALAAVLAEENTVPRGTRTRTSVPAQGPPKPARNSKASIFEAPTQVEQPPAPTQRSGAAPPARSRGRKPRS